MHRVGSALHQIAGAQRQRRSKAFTTASDARLEALFVMDDGAITKRRRHILDLAASHHLPVASIYGDFAKAGAFLPTGRACPPSTGAVGILSTAFSRARRQVTFRSNSRRDLFINLKTAKALGITIPLAVLVRADEVIE